MKLSFDDLRKHIAYGLELTRKFIHDSIKLLKKHKKIIIIISLIILLIMSIFFGLRFFLFLNYLVGNDVLIKLTPGEDSVRLAHGEMAELSMHASLTQNPFCSTSCTSRLVSLRDGSIVSERNATQRNFLHTASIQSPDSGHGFAFYRFEVTCSSTPTTFCHTSQRSTTRNHMVIVPYGPEGVSMQFAEEFHRELQRYAHELHNITTRFLRLEEERNALATRIVMVDMYIETIDSYVARAQEMTESLQNLWDEGAYTEIRESLSALQNQFQTLHELIDVAKNEYDEVRTAYNEIIEEVSSTYEDLQGRSSAVHLSNETARTFNEMHTLFEEFTERISSPLMFSELRVAYEELMQEFANKRRVFDRSVLQIKNQKYIDAYIFENILCKYAGVCKYSFNLGSNITSEYVCARYDTILDDIAILTRGMHTISQGLSAEGTDLALYKEYMLLYESLDNTSTFYPHVRARIETLTNQTEFMNSTSLNDLMVNQSLQNSSILFGLPSFTDERCSERALPSLLAFTMVPESASIDEVQPLFFSPSEPVCCIFGDCKPCCPHGECDSLYPIVFVHGHAFNQQIDVDYSFNLFNRIQRNLEREGFVNMGSLTDPSVAEEFTGIWEMFPIPISIKVSYYYDSFYSLDNIVVVQAKSENIDTYAIRLRELIEAVKTRTGQDKVIIVAHSMGGLVSQRYIQLFGDMSVDTLIQIGTPNHGVSGRIAQFCGFPGSKLECRDMQEGSVLLGKLRAGRQPSVPIYNFVGVGCDMEGSDGDGIVRRDSAYLEGAENIIIEGSCAGIDFLHIEMVSPVLYPELYERLRDIINERRRD
ncbi:MAG: alpha/beta fold hydrolase [Candidatus Woesearchaeota archaeon]